MENEALNVTSSPVKVEPSFVPQSKSGFDFMKIIQEYWWVILIVIIIIYVLSTQNKKKENFTKDKKKN